MRLVASRTRRLGHPRPVRAAPKRPLVAPGRSGQSGASGTPVGLELAPVSLELMGDTEREATLDAIAELYDSVGRPFQLLSIPAERDPRDHLDAMSEHVAGRRTEKAMAAYAALYRETAAVQRRLRRTWLLVDASSETEHQRVRDALLRTAGDRGVVVRPAAAEDTDALWRSVAGPGVEHRIEPGLIMGSGVAAALVPARRWPAQVEPGWLTALLALDGVGAVSMRVRPLGRAEAMTFMTRSLRQARAAGRLAAERGEIDDVERERVGETAQAARRAVHAGRGRVCLVDTVLMVEAEDAAALHDRIEAIRLEGKALGLDLDVPTFRLRDAWMSVVPGPAPRSIAERNLDSASLGACLLHAASDLYEPRGHLVGRARSSGAPIVLDRFAHASHSAIVLGQTGTGKTMLTGAEMSRCLIRGVRVLAVDPLGDYRRLGADLGGTYLDLGSPGVALNPFAFTGAATDGALAAKIAGLSRLAAAMAGGLTREERPALDRALRDAYSAAGIGPDPGTLDRTPPTLVDLVDQLATASEGIALSRRLERWATGSLAHIFAGGATLPLDRRLVVIGLSELLDPEVRAVAQLAALGLLWDAVRRDLTPKLIVVDEAWKVMRQPSGAEFIEELARSARHYHAGLQLATQDIVEFLRSDYGESILKQCDQRVLLGQTPEGADALARYFDLTPAERRSLVHARPGEGLLFVGRSHVAFESIVSRREYAMLTTPPSDQLAAQAEPATR